MKHRAYNKLIAVILLICFMLNMTFCADSDELKDNSSEDTIQNSETESAVMSNLLELKRIFKSIDSDLLQKIDVEKNEFSLDEIMRKDPVYSEMKSYRKTLSEYLDFIETLEKTDNDKVNEAYDAADYVVRSLIKYIQNYGVKNGTISRYGRKVSNVDFDEYFSNGINNIANIVLLSEQIKKIRDEFKSEEILNSSTHQIKCSNIVSKCNSVLAVLNDYESKYNTKDILGQGSDQLFLEREMQELKALCDDLTEYAEHDLTAYEKHIIYLDGYVKEYINIIELLIDSGLVE